MERSTEERLSSLETEIKMQSALANEKLHRSALEISKTLEDAARCLLNHRNTSDNICSDNFKNCAEKIKCSIGSLKTKIRNDCTELDFKIEAASARISQRFEEEKLHREKNEEDLLSTLESAVQSLQNLYRL